MRTSTLFMLASLFLIGSYSLPQPETLEASKTIENREAEAPHGHAFDDYDGGSERWRHLTNGTKIKGREEHYGRPNGRPGDRPEFFNDRYGGGNPGTNSTKIKQRQGPPGGDTFVPPDDMTWKEWMHHGKHKEGSPSQPVVPPLTTGTSGTTVNDKTVLSTGHTGANGTRVKMMKLRD